MNSRIVFIPETPEFGGAEKHLIEVIRALDRSRESVIWYFPVDFYSPFLQDTPNVKAIARRTRVTLATLPLFWLALVRLRPAVVVFVKGTFDAYRWYAYLAARCSGATRVVAIEHLTADPAPPQPVRSGVLSWVRRAFGWRARAMLRIRLSARLVHRTICVSNAVRRRLVDEYGYPAARTVTILNGIDLQYYRRSGKSRAERRLELGIDPDVQLLVSVARLSGAKRLDRLLSSMAMIRPNRPLVRCLIVGAGPLEAELKAQASGLGLGETVRFEGYREDVRPYLEAADVYVSTSDMEGFGLALAEAMALELPCVASNIGGHDEVLADPATGVLVASDNEAELVHAVGYLLDHPAEARAMGRNARAAVEARFDIARMLRETAGVLDGHLVRDSEG